MSATPEANDDASPPGASSNESSKTALPHHIRGLRVMAGVRWALLVFVTLIAARTMWRFWGPSSAVHSAHQADHYYCPMHPQIRSPEPGECPICHMNLEPIPAERRSETASVVPAVANAPPPDVVAVSMLPEKQQAVGLLTSEVTTETLGGSLRVPGVVNAPETGMAQVRVRAAGFVEKVAVSQTGVRVTRGQTLAWIYSPDIYRAQEEFLAATRWTASPATGTASPAGEIASAARRGLELLGLEQSDIDELVRTGQPTRSLPVRAPSSGYVTRFNAVLGFRADPETVLYELADLSTVWVIASVHERDIANIRAGSAVYFTAAGSAATRVEARVELVEPLLDESTRTSRVRILLKNKKFAFRPGQYGEVEFSLPAAKGLFVPRDAVIHTGENEYVYVVNGNDRFEPRSIRSGIEFAARTQILEGLAAGERVVTRGSFMLDSESRLQASLAAGPTASAPTPPAAPSVVAPSERGAR